LPKRNQKDETKPAVVLADKYAENSDLDDYESEAESPPHTPSSVIGPQNRISPKRGGVKRAGEYLTPERRHRRPQTPEQSPFFTPRQSPTSSMPYEWDYEHNPESPMSDDSDPNFPSLAMKTPPPMVLDFSVNPESDANQKWVKLGARPKVKIQTEIGRGKQKAARSSKSSRTNDLEISPQPSAASYQLRGSDSRSPLQKVTVKKDPLPSNHPLKAIAKTPLVPNANATLLTDASRTPRLMMSDKTTIQQKHASKNNDDILESQLPMQPAQTEVSTTDAQMPAASKKKARKPKAAAAPLPTRRSERKRPAPLTPPSKTYSVLRKGQPKLVPKRRVKIPRNAAD
jgi:hypothetical protein